jgi:hypothetical protein
MSEHIYSHLISIMILLSSNAENFITNPLPFYSCEEAKTLRSMTYKGYKQRLEDGMPRVLLSKAATYAQW